MSEFRDVIWLWPDDPNWHAIGLEIEGGVRYVRQPESKSMAELGKRGGQSTSKKKRKATQKNLEKARKMRWPKKGQYKI